MSYRYVLCLISYTAKKTCLTGMSYVLYLIQQRKHHFNCEIYTACMYLQTKLSFQVFTNFLKPGADFSRQETQVLCGIVDLFGDQILFLDHFVQLL